MPDYYFDVAHDIGHDSGGRDVDMHLPDIEAARVHAIRLAAIAAEKPGAEGGAVVVGVRDGAGAEVLKMRLAFSVVAE